MNQKSYFKYWWPALTVALLLAGCTNSLVLGKVYDSFGSQSAKNFKSYATFDQQQKKQVDQLAASYHSWHRSTQLTRYAKLLRRVVADIEGDATIDLQTANDWWMTVRSFSDEMRRCNPLNVSAGFLAGLSDRQVRQISAKLRTDHNQREDEYHAETAEERIERRFKEIKKWSKRAGAAFNPEQQRLLRKTLTDQISLGGKRFEVRRVWLEHFIALLKERDQPGFKSKIDKHIDATWQLTASTFPDRWASNEQLWVKLLHNYFNLQTKEQRQSAIEKALKVAATIEKLSKEELLHEPVCHTAQTG